MGTQDAPRRPIGVSSHFRAVRRVTEDANTALVKEFFDEIRRFAEAQIGKHMRPTIGASDIANATLRSALSEVRKKGAEDWSSDKFRGLAKTIAKNKIRDEADRLKAQKRVGSLPTGTDGTGATDGSEPADATDNQRPAVKTPGKATTRRPPPRGAFPKGFIADDGIADADAPTDDPGMRVAARELAVKIAAKTFDCVATGDMVSHKQLIASLTIGGYTPKEIHDILKTKSPKEGDDPIPSLRLVQLVAKKSREVFEDLIDQQNTAQNS